MDPLPARRTPEYRDLVETARIIYRNALVSGKIVKRPCEKCGETKVEGHHDDYRKPLEVRWLCRKHHVEHHVLVGDRKAI